MDEGFLIHYGMPKRSGRYPWGSGKRPFQSGGGPVGKAVQKVQKATQKKKQKKTLEKARKVAAENRSLEANKERVLKSGSAREVRKYKGRLTNKELGDAVKRLELEAKLDEYAKKEIKTGMDKIDKVMKDVERVTNWTKTGTKAWNQLADIYNSTDEGQRRPLRKIRDDTQQQRRENH